MVHHYLAPNPLRLVAASLCSAKHSNHIGSPNFICLILGPPLYPPHEYPIKFSSEAVADEVPKVRGFSGENEEIIRSRSLNCNIATPELLTYCLH